MFEKKHILKLNFPKREMKHVFSMERRENLANRSFVGFCGSIIFRRSLMIDQQKTLCHPKYLIKSYNNRIC